MCITSETGAFTKGSVICHAAEWARSAESGPAFAPLRRGCGGRTRIIVRQLERKHGRALNILSLSGGGQNGAFGAGFLLGWRESGQRPEFDIVGGVSTGALLATHALLGTPADDAQLEEMYTQITKKDIYDERGIFSLAFGADSLSDTTPLRALIAKYITAETLKRVAAAYDDNRITWSLARPTSITARPGSGICR